MITLDGITRKVGADELTWLWPWMRDGDRDFKYESTVFKRKFRDVESYKRWVGAERWSLAENKITALPLLDIIGDYVTEINPGRTSVVLLDHSIDMESDAQIADLFGEEKATLLANNGCIIMDFEDPMDAHDVIMHYGTLPRGVAMMVQDGKVISTSMYMHALIPTVNIERMLKNVT